MWKLLPDGYLLLAGQHLLGRTMRTEQLTRFVPETGSLNNFSIRRNMSVIQPTQFFLLYSIIKTNKPHTLLPLFLE